MRVYFILIKYFSKRTKKNENNIKSQKKRQHKTMFSYEKYNYKPIHRYLTSQKQTSNFLLYYNYG